MKTKMYLVFIGVFLFSAFAKAEHLPLLDKECIYVIATGGLNMRDSAGPNGKVIAKFPYGTKLDWTPPGSSDVKSYVMDNGKKVEGYWVKVWKSVPWEDLEGNLGGYVFSGYLSYHLKEIPQSSLYLYNHFTIQEESTNTYFTSDYKVNTDTYNYSAYIDCYPWYEEHSMIHTASNNGKNIHISNPADTLKSIVKLELVDFKRVISQKKTTDFDLDYRFQPKLLPLKNGEGSFDFLNRYYLPLKSGDSVEVKAHSGEYPHNVEYIGELKKQNKFLVAANFEGWEYAWIDQFTGKRDNAAIPKIAPNNRYGISHEVVYYEKGAQIGISYFDKNFNIEKTLYVNFQSWAVSSSISDSFWISNNEIVLKVHPIDNTMQEVDLDKPIEPHWQYLKMTIL